jgi:hypothetical protein
VDLRVRVDEGEVLPLQFSVRLSGAVGGDRHDP